MAFAPDPVMLLAGTCRQVELSEQVVDAATGESRQVARCEVLTEPNGGFARVYVSADSLEGLPDLVAAAAAGEPFPIAWYVTVAAWNRAMRGQENVPATERRRYADLNVRFASLAQPERVRAVA